MHDYGPVLAGFGLVYRELAGAVKTELFADAFSVHVVEAVFQYPVRVPVAPDAVPFGFAFDGRVSPKAFASHSAAHAVGIKTAGYKENRSTVFPFWIVAKIPVFFIK